MIFGESVEIWHIFYLHHTKQKYMFDGKQLNHLKQLVKKIRVKTIEAGMEDNPENISNSFKGFLNSISDPWIIDHLEISLVNSKFNVLYASAVKNSPLGIKSNLEGIIIARRNSQRPG